MALIHGTGDDDYLTDTAADDILYGYAGNDTLVAALPAMIRLIRRSPIPWERTSRC